MQLTINSNTIGIAVAFCMQLGALFWWASHIQTQQENILSELDKQDEIQKKYDSLKEDYFSLRSRLYLLENRK